MKGNKRWVCRCINSIRKKMEKVNPLLGQAGDLTKEKEKVEIFSAFFLPSVLIDKFCFQFFLVSIKFYYLQYSTVQELLLTVSMDPNRDLLESWICTIHRMRQDAFATAERPGRCHGKATLCCLWKAVMIKGKRQSITDDLKCSCILCARFLHFINFEQNFQKLNLSVNLRHLGLLQLLIYGWKLVLL